MKQNLLYRRPRVERDLLGPASYPFYDDSIRGQGNNKYEIHSEQEKENDRDNKSGLTILAPGQYIQGTHFKARNLREFVRKLAYPPTIDSFDAYQGSHPRFPNISLTDQEVTRWKMASRAVQLILSNESDTRDYGLVAQRCKDWPKMDDIFDELPIALGFSAAALIYGGLHALAWSAHFDTSTEQLLWRISACMVIGGIPVILALFKLCDFMDEHLFNATSDIISNFASIVAGLAFLAYVLARAYLVVECFINLSHLPAGVYDVPTWSTYFPHIS